MCRYGDRSYRSHFGCFACRKVFRRWALPEAGEPPRPQRCPDCAGSMADLGMDLRAPPRRDVKAWKALEGMFRIGHAFQTCGCHGPGYIPETPGDYRRHLERMLGAYRERLAELDGAASAGDRRDQAAYWSERIALVERALAELPG